MGGFVGEGKPYWLVMKLCSVDAGADDGVDKCN